MKHAKPIPKRRKQRSSDSTISKQYQTVIAPYDGVVSARNAQIGALINSGGAGAETVSYLSSRSATGLRERPSTLYSLHQPGLEVQVRVAEFQNQPFKGQSRSLCWRTRSDVAHAAGRNSDP